MFCENKKKNHVPVCVVSVSSGLVQAIVRAPVGQRKGEKTSHTSSQLSLEFADITVHTRTSLGLCRYMSACTKAASASTKIATFILEQLLEENRHRIASAPAFENLTNWRNSHQRLVKYDRGRPAFMLMPAPTLSS